MRSLIIAATIILTLTAACAQEPLATASFEGDLEGWELRLNRGAEVELSYPEDAALGAQSLRFEPQRLCAPDDRAASTNIHIWLERFRMEAGHYYELSAWAKSEEPGRRFLLGGRRADAPVNLGMTAHEAGPRWQRFRHTFNIRETVDDARLQIIAGGDERPLMIDAVTFGELPENPLLPADYLTRESDWDDPRDWSAATDFPHGGGVRIPGVATWRQSLPADYDLQLLLTATEPTTLELLSGGQVIKSVQFPAGKPKQTLLLQRRDAEPAREIAFSNYSRYRVTCVVGGGSRQ